MDTTGLRAAYDTLFDVAATPGLGEPADGGWNADRILAHLLSVDAAVGAVALAVTSGARPAFDNRVCLDTANLDRIVAEHGDRANLMSRLRSQAAVLCGLVGQLGDRTAEVLVPVLLVSNDEVVLDEPIPLGALVDGLAEDHIPRHTQQLRDLRVTGRRAG